MGSDSTDSRYAWLEREVERDATIVTASRRLARDLGTAYAERQLAAGENVWRTPQILYWPDWLSRMRSSAGEAAELPRQLDTSSVSILWERCLGRRVPEDVLNLGGVVRQALRAWQRLGEWSVPVSALLATAGTDDERLFARAAADYTDLLHQHDWSDSAALPGIVASLLSNEPGLAPPRLVLAGFDRISPSVRQVLAALETAGTEVDTRPFADRSRNVQAHAFPDAAAELRAAGHWARRHLDKHSGCKLAIISTALEADAEDAARLVREGLVPGWQYGGTGHRAAANLSYGRRLAEYPAISVALLLLRWTCHGLSGKEVSLLLRNRCFGSEASGGRYRLERALRTHPDREWQPADFVAALTGACETPDAAAFLDLAMLVDGVRAAAGDERRAPAAWVPVADELLEKAGWPGPDTLDSVAYQLVNRWRELMNDFAKTATVEPDMRWQDAVSRVAAMAAETVWQPDSGPGIVSVLGVLEAYGMEFDGVWVCGMDASQWPPPSKPLPCVSRALQRDRNMPDSTPADTLAFARRLLGRLAGAAPECVFSWAEARQDALLTPSTLLDGLAPAGPGDFCDPGWAAMSMIGAAEPDPIPDDPVPPVARGEIVRGGSYTLQRQFSEPFSAFVYGRLGVRPLDPFWKGLSPGIRGNVIHGALHNLLSACPTQAELAAWRDRDRRIGSAVDAALDKIGRHADRVLQRMIGLEGRRLRRMLDDFVEAETDRAEFAVVDVEKDVDYCRDGLDLRFRIDRIDRLADDRLLVIDYKTGAPKSFLNRERALTNLQLVAYADALGEPIGGLLFINVDTREIGYRGAGDGWTAAGDETWDATLQGWRDTVHAIVSALAAGDARILIDQTTADARPLAILSRFEELTRDG